MPSLITTIYKLSVQNWQKLMGTLSKGGTLSKSMVKRAVIILASKKTVVAIYFANIRAVLKNLSCCPAFLRKNRGLTRNRSLQTLRRLTLRGVLPDSMLSLQASPCLDREY